MIMLGNCIRTMNTHKSKLGHRFKIKDLGDAQFILGLEIIRDQDGRVIMLSQCRYIDDMAMHFGLTDAKPSPTPLAPGIRLTKDDCPHMPQEKADMEKVPYQSLIGSLMYTMLGTRPDIAYAVGALSKFSANPGQVHWNEAKHVLWYLIWTRNHVIRYDADAPNSELTTRLMHGYSDSDWAGDQDTRRSTAGYVFLMAGGAVSWSSKIQRVVALS
jgi:Reverse transcriptase (RNA-dependent DNA polymerase)